MDDATNAGLVRFLVAEANANAITDAADLEQCFRKFGVVFGVWQERDSELGVEITIIKGRGSLERIRRIDEGETLSITAVRCKNADEAEAMRQLYGDQPAEVVLLREP